MSAKLLEHPVCFVFKVTEINERETTRGFRFENLLRDASRWTVDGFELVLWAKKMFSFQKKLIVSRVLNSAEEKLNFKRVGGLKNVSNLDHVSRKWKTQNYFEARKISAFDRLLRENWFSFHLVRNQFAVKRFSATQKKAPTNR